MSKAYEAPDLDKTQNLVWPENPSWDNPLVAICHKDRYCRFNFVVKDGSYTRLNPGDI